MDKCFLIFFCLGMKGFLTLLFFHNRDNCSPFGKTFCVLQYKEWARDIKKTQYVLSPFMETKKVCTGKINSCVRALFISRVINYCLY